MQNIPKRTKTGNQMHEALTQKLANTEQKLRNGGIQNREKKKKKYIRNENIRIIIIKIKWK